MVKIFVPAAVAVAGTVATFAATSADALSPIAEQTGNLLHMAHVEFPTGASCAGRADSVKSFLTEKGFTPFIRTFTNTPLFCGVSFALSDSSRNATDAVKDLGGSLTIYPVQTRFKPTVINTNEVAAATTEPIHSLTGVDKARSELGLTGKGITVGVIDSGIYYKHPALGGGFGAGFKVVKGYDFVGDEYNAQTGEVQPDPDPLDECSEESHGTHVAGIVAGDARNITQAGFVPTYPWTGVAPDAKIAAYRVFGCEGQTGNDIITSAIYAAAADGVDVINMSLGGGPSFPDDADTIAVERVSQAGVIVFASAGNDGASGLFTASNPAGSLGGFSIASIENVETVKFSISIGGVVFPWSPGATNGNFGNPQTLNIFINNPNAVANNVQNDGCTSVNRGAAGKAVVLRWGSGCGSAARCNVALAAGATACIIYSNTDNIISIAGGNLPSASTTREFGDALLKNPSAPVVITKVAGVYPYPTGKTVSSFSSGGPDAELHFKPDFGAIGGQVYSTISPHAAQAQGYLLPYASYDGTSMASPYAAGIGALLLQQRGKISFDDVKTALYNGAVPVKQYKSDNVDTVANQGAGLLNIYNTATAKTVVTPSYLALNDSQYTRKDHYSVNIKNNYGKPVSYTVTNVGAVTATPFDSTSDFVRATAAYSTDYASLGFGNKQEAVFTTVVNAGETHQVNVKITPPASANASLFPVYSGYITITNNVDSSVVRVPYTGIVGKWSDAPILVRKNPTASLNAGFTQTTGAAIVANSTINLTRNNIALSAAFAGTTRNGVAEVIYTGTNQTVKNILNDLGVGHNKIQGIPVVRSSNRGPFAGVFFGAWPRMAPAAGQSIQVPTKYYWGGEVVADTDAAFLVKLPPGEYKLRLKGLKHFNSPSSRGDEHYDIIETPTFKIAY